MVVFLVDAGCSQTSYPRLTWEPNRKSVKKALGPLYKKRQNSHSSFINEYLKYYQKNIRTVTINNLFSETVSIYISYILILTWFVSDSGQCPTNCCMNCCLLKVIISKKPLFSQCLVWYFWKNNNTCSHMWKLQCLIWISSHRVPTVRIIKHKVYWPITMLFPTLYFWNTRLWIWIGLFENSLFTSFIYIFYF